MKKYDYVGTYNEGLCTVKKDGLFGFIDILGIERVPCIYKSVRNFIDGITEVEDINGNLICLDFNNKEVECTFSDEDNIEIIVDDSDDKMGFNNLYNSTKVPCKYDFINNDYIINDTMQVSINKTYGFININSGIEVIPCKYDFLGFFSEGLCDAILDYNNNRKFGFLDTFGNLVLDFIYDDIVEGFNEGLCGVKKGNLWGFIDKYNNIVIDFTYDEVKIFSEGICSVKLENEWFHINKKGERI